MEHKPLFPSELPEAEVGVVRDQWIGYFRVAFKLQMLDPDVGYSKWQNKDPQGWITYSIEDVLAPASTLREMLAIAQRIIGHQPYFSKMDKEKRLQIISQVILFDLLDHGFFIKDPKFELRRYYFHEKEKEVFSIREGFKFNQVFESYLCVVYNLLTNAETILKFIYSYAMNTYKERDIHRFFHYDRKDEVLYVFDREKEYYRLTGKTVKKFPNGIHVLFQKETNSRLITYIPLEERTNPEFDIKGNIRKEKTGDYLWQLFFERTNFDQHSNLSLDEQTVQLGLYFYSIPFVNMLNTKPIMALIGEKGSGKTFTIKMIGKFLIKDDFAVRILDDKESLIVAVANNLIVVLDNVDYLKPWFQDTITSIATGGSIGKRELYTTLEELEVTPSCFIVLTSRNPYFKRDDVADRLLLFHCARIAGFVDEEDLMFEIYENRDFLWSLYIDDLNEIVKTLRDTSLRCFQTTHRLADWAKLSYIIDSALKLSEKYNVNFMTFLRNVEYERAAFQFKDNNILPLLKEFTVNNKGEWLTASAIINELIKYDDSLDITPKKLGRLLNSKSSALKTLIGFDVFTDSHGRVKKYKFGDDSSLLESPAITLEGFLENGELVKTPLYDLVDEVGGDIKTPPYIVERSPPNLFTNSPKTTAPSETEISSFFSINKFIERSLESHNGNPISIKRILDAGELMGINVNKLNKYIDTELGEGNLFEPKQGFIKKP